MFNHYFSIGGRMHQTRHVTESRTHIKIQITADTDQNKKYQARVGCLQLRLGKVTKLFLDTFATASLDTRAFAELQIRKGGQNICQANKKLTLKQLSGSRKNITGSMKNKNKGTAALTVSYNEMKIEKKYATEEKMFLHTKNINLSIKY